MKSWYTCIRMDVEFRFDVIAEPPQRQKVADVMNILGCRLVIRVSRMIVQRRGEQGLARFVGLNASGGKRDDGRYLENEGRRPQETAQLDPLPSARSLLAAATPR